MPSDIRSFFGGKPAGSPAEPAKPKKAEEPKKRGRARKVVEDDEDDEPAPKKATPKKSSAKKQLESEPVMEETTADDFFGKGNKPKRSEPVRPKAPSKPAIKKEAEEESKPTKSTSKKATPNGKTSTRNKPTKSYAEFDADDFTDDDMEDDADDVFKAGAKSGRKMDDAYEEGTDDEDNAPIQPKRTAGRTGKQKTLRGHDQDDADEDVEMKDTNADDDFVVPDDDEEIVEDKPATKTKSAAAKKRKAPVVDDDDDDDDLDVEETKPTRKRASPVKKATPAKKQKKEEPKTNNSVQAIFDSIPTIEPPSPSGDGDTKKKFQYGQHKNAEAPAGAIDPSDYPTGQDNCLAGLSFVFTGQLATLGREAGSALVKQYGGKVMTAPSKKTSYVVLGEEAGPKKIQTIKAHKLKVIQEEGLFDLIRKLPANGGDSAAAEEYAKKQQKEEENIRKAAAEMEQQERAKLAAAKPKPQANGSASASQQSGKARAEGQDPKNQLWTVRYAPQSLSQICGNKAQVEKLGRWLRAFPKNQRTNFKMPGADGSGTFRAVMIHGPPGIGKTTAAHLVAKLEGYDIVESNASDTRSKKLIENSLKGVLSTTSLMGYFSSGADQVEASKKKLVLIMDEVDGLSAGDRGGVGAIAAVAKKSQIPMILICNERKQPKMKPFDFVTYDLGFRRPTTEMIRSRISSIAYKEELKMPANVMTALIEGTGADIRQVINMISTAKLDAANMSYEDSKDMSKAWEKHIVLKPWDMVGKILNGSMFNPANNSSLNDKQELYFNDHDFAPLMLQENYLGTKPTRSGKYNAQPKKKALADLDLISNAADSISDGDLVDRMIHGSQQQWSLMPTHAMFSFVRPASFVYGSMAGNQTRFTSWMGKNSTQGKLMRMIKEIQGHMRLRTSGDRFEIRQTYLPLLFDRLIKRLQIEGKDAVPEIIELMDEYFLTKDDWDAIMELGVGDADMEKIKIETQAKATFTRLYNQKSHPLPFIKSSQVVAPKKGATKEKPDLEEALEESEEEAADDADVKEEDDNDLSKDKYVKAPKKKRAPAAKGKGKGKKAADDDDDDDEDVKPARGKGKAAAGKGRAKK